MAAQKNLITKARLEAIKDAQRTLIDNLAAHANSSLSKAHGFVFYNLPHPTLDSEGNDISSYTDSHGDRVGYYQLRLTYNNTNYFVPLETSLLPGKDATTGLSVTPSTQVTTPGSTVWVTDFTPEDEQDLINANQSLLLPHTQKGHWETHTGGVYQIIAQTVYDNAGHTVANYVARVIVDGVELLLPCEPRAGGPVQPVRFGFPGISTFEGSNHNICEMGRDDTQTGMFWFNVAGGTLPYTYKWQINTYAPVSGAWGAAYKDPSIGSGSWLDIPSTPTSGNLPGSSPYAGTYELSAPNRLKITTANNVVGDSKRVVATVRAVFTNTAGTVYSNWCLFYANDEDGSWVFSDPDQNQSHYYAAIKNDPVWQEGYYV